MPIMGPRMRLQRADLARIFAGKFGPRLLLPRVGCSIALPEVGSAEHEDLLDEQYRAIWPDHEVTPRDTFKDTAA